MGCGFRVSARDPPCILVVSPVRKSVQFFLEQIALCVLRVSPFVSAFDFLRFAKQSEKVDTCGLEVSTFLTLPV